MKIIKLTLMSIFSLTLTSPAILASERDDIYWYGYTWGGMYSACLAYQFGDMSKEVAKQYIQMSYDNGEEVIKNKNIFYKLKALQEEGESFKNCRDIIAK